MNELEIVKKDLLIAKQQAELLEAKFELQKVQAQKVSRLEDSLLSPGLYEHYIKVAEIVASSGLVPKQYIGKPNDVFVAMAMGYQLGFPIEQALQDIAVVNGRPCLWGDGLLALVLSHPDFEDIKEEALTNESGAIIGYSCTIKRRGVQAHTKTFTLDDARKANLSTKEGVWKLYPDRMMQLRARAFALRDRFSDALRGLRQAEVEQDDESNIIDAEIINVSEQVSELKQIIEAKNNVAPLVNQDLEVQQVNQSTLETLKNLTANIEQDRFLNMLNHYKVNALTELTQKQAENAIKKLQKV